MRSGTRRRALALAAWLVGTAGVAQAHEFWIEPSAFTPALGAELPVALRVGDTPAGAEAYPRNARHFSRFDCLGPGGERSVPGEDFSDPAGRLRVEVPGLHLLVYQSRGSFLELEAGKFEAYLREEGLEHAIAWRAERGQSARAGRELYLRCAKALVTAGGVGAAEVGERGGEPGTAGATGPADASALPGSDSAASAASAPRFDAVLGLPCELVPQVDPTALAPGSDGADLPLLVLAAGVPLAGVRVDAQSLDHATQHATGRSDEQGRVVLRLPAGGRWLVAAVYMTPAAPDGSPVQGHDYRGVAVESDWTSAWASLTFATR